MNKKGLIVLIVISVLAVVIFGAAFALLPKGSVEFEFSTEKSPKGPKSSDEMIKIFKSEKSFSSGKDYIAILYIEGVITDETKTYSQEYIIDTIENLIKDRKNVGILLALDTPGGAMYEADELYLKLEEYKTKTERPIYAYMGSMTASAGYYLACSSEKIIANRNTLTGSIGVRMGSSIVDATELLDKIGIKTTSVYSGKNKNMGSMTEPFTPEQKAIMQSLADEAYEQFAEVVKVGRNMSIETVYRLADGRPYSASQALSNGLIDEIATWEEAIEEFKEKISHDLSSEGKKFPLPEVRGFRYEQKFSWDYLFGKSPILKKTSSRPFELQAMVD